jgi:peptidoglycan/xylan/chitin deacetylase (PgdA/CDA1 family)
MRELLGKILYYIFYPFLKHRLDLLSIYFHDPSPALFEIIVKWLVKRNYQFLSINEFTDILQNAKPFTDKVAFFSFDDGRKRNLELIPIIEKYQIPITIFVSTEPLIAGSFWWDYVMKEYGKSQLNRFKEMNYDVFKHETHELKKKHILKRKVLTVEEVISIASNPLVSIQSHTVTHPILTKCTDDQLKFELEQSKFELEELISAPVFAFSYPNGSFGNREIEAVKAAGYTCAFTTKQSHPTLTENLFLIPRMCLNTNGGMYENLAKILGVWQIFIKRN